MTEKRSVHSINGTIGALESWARMTKAQRSSRTAKAREGWLSKLANELDPDHKLPEHVRMERAEELRRARMLRLAQRSRKRRAKADPS